MGLTLPLESNRRTMIKIAIVVCLAALTAAEADADAWYQPYGYSMYGNNWNNMNSMYPNNWNNMNNMNNMNYMNYMNYMNNMYQNMNYRNNMNSLAGTVHEVPGLVHALAVQKQESSGDVSLSTG